MSRLASVLVYAYFIIVIVGTPITIAFIMLKQSENKELIYNQLANDMSINHRLHLQCLDELRKYEN